MKKTIYLLAMLMIVCGTAQAQDYRRAARMGNSLYKEKKYSDAETAYRRSLAQDSTFYKAQYNLGNSLYKQKKYDIAKKYYAKAAETPDISEKEKSAALHNMGNCAMQEGLEKRGTPDAIKSYQEAVEAYKNSLKASDKNDNTKYNLAMAQQLLRHEQQQQQQNQQNQDKNQQDKQQNKQDQNKDQNKDKQNKDQQNKQNQDQQNKDKQKQ
ncbi:MAG: tetratricopeptide repeat protein, partial [Bacteroidales bacterium]|nr:tetratricopeptide repeat protein [Bacteroidales bacterium]